MELEQNRKLNKMPNNYGTITFYANFPENDEIIEFEINIIKNANLVEIHYCDHIKIEESLINKSSRIIRCSTGTVDKISYNIREVRNIRDIIEDEENKQLLKNSKITNNKNAYDITNMAVESLEEAFQLKREKVDEYFYHVLIDPNTHIEKCDFEISRTGNNFKIHTVNNEKELNFEEVMSFLETQDIVRLEDYKNEPIDMAHFQEKFNKKDGQIR